MCLDCTGLGVQYGANLTQNRELTALSPLALMHWIWDQEAYHALGVIKDFLSRQGIIPDAPLTSQSTKERAIVFDGEEDGWFSHKDSDGRPIQLRWVGCNIALAKAGKSAHPEKKEAVLPWLEEHQCPSCSGERLNPLARAVTLQGDTIGTLCTASLTPLIRKIEKLCISKEGFSALSDVKEQLLTRLRFLEEVGVGYLALERRAPTLSGGEMQRLRLARQLGSSLTGVLYVLDEPTIGLHARDTAKLHTALHKLQALGNTLLLVEHDPLTIAQADYILDFGPGAGAQGGHITARGTLKQIMRNRSSLTGDYLTGRKLIEEARTKRRPAQGTLQISQATKHNLKNISVNLPLGVMTVLSGVSGSGKSSLLHGVLLPALRKGLDECDTITLACGRVDGISQIDKVIAIDQNPIGHTARSDVGTYVDVLGKVREFFSMLPASQIKGLQPRHFSCNQRKGMCTACWGMGYRRVEMHFLPPVRVVCAECAGLRLNPVSLTVQYKGKNFGEYLNSTITEARHAFETHPKITRILDTLISVGLGYLTLGQEMVSLSGGEAQRIKLSRELGKRATGKTLYLLDEPTTGLHSDDISKLLALLHRLIQKGNSVILIEHNLDVIRSADWVVELGPDAGEKGGQILCCGTPEEIMRNPQSPTAPFLLAQNLT
jgi:excinuclease ABC subunit A